MSVVGLAALHLVHPTRYDEQVQLDFSHTKDAAKMGFAALDDFPSLFWAATYN